MESKRTQVGQEGIELGTLIESGKESEAENDVSTLADIMTTTSKKTVMMEVESGLIKGDDDPSLSSETISPDYTFRQTETRTVPMANVKATDDGSTWPKIAAGSTDNRPPLRRRATRKQLRLAKPGVSILNKDPGSGTDSGTGSGSGSASEQGSSAAATTKPSRIPKSLEFHDKTHLL